VGKGRDLTEGLAILDVAMKQKKNNRHPARRRARHSLVSKVLILVLVFLATFLVLGLVWLHDRQVVLTALATIWTLGIEFRKTLFEVLLELWIYVLKALAHRK